MADFQTFNAAVAEVARVPPEQVTATARFDELELDSLRMLELLVVLADFGAESPEDVTEACATVGDAYEMLTGARRRGSFGR